jgi:hypothetical protein
MADPRGLSGAVYQQTPVRDFTKDLLLRKQLGAEQAAKQQSSTEDFLAEYNVKMPDGLTPEYMASYLPLLDKYKVRAGEMAVLRTSNPAKYRKELGAFNNFKNGLITGAEAAKQKVAIAEATKNQYDSNIDSYTPENGEIIKASLQNSFYPEGDFAVDEEGNVLFNGGLASDTLRAERFNAPLVEYDLRASIVDQYSGKTKEGVFDQLSAINEIKRGKTSSKQQKQFQTFLTEVKGYDEEMSQTAFENDGEALYQEFVNFAIGEIRAEINENAEKDSGDDSKGNDNYVVERRSTVLDDGTSSDAIPTFTFPKNKLKVNIFLGDVGDKPSKDKEKTSASGYINDYTALPNGKFKINVSYQIKDANNNTAEKTKTLTVGTGSPLFNSMLAALKEEKYDTKDPKFNLFDPPKAIGKDQSKLKAVSEDKVVEAKAGESGVVWEQN